MTIRNCLALVLLMATLPFSAALAETPAEKAARTERPLTDAEIERRRKGCAWPNSDERHPLFAGFNESRVASLPKTPLLIIGRREYVDGKAVPTMEAMLPGGGIGGKDLCGVMIMFDLAKEAAPQVIVIRLHPDIDLHGDYPAASAIIRDTDRLAYLPTGGYVIAKLPEPKSADRGRLIAQFMNTAVRAGAKAFASDGAHLIAPLDTQ